MNELELRRTSGVRVDIDEASVKISFAPTDDSDEDQALPIWSGTVAARLVFGAPIRDTNGAAARADLPIAASLVRLSGRLSGRQS